MLTEAEEILPKLLHQPERWSSGLFSDNAQKIERVWCHQDGWTLNLNRIIFQSCQANFRRSSYDIFTKIIEGEHEIAIASDELGRGAVVNCSLLPGSTFHFTSPMAWYLFIACKAMGVSLSVTRKFCNPKLNSKPSFNISSLTEDKFLSLLDLFKAYYPAKIEPCSSEVCDGH